VRSNFDDDYDQDGTDASTFKKDFAEAKSAVTHVPACFPAMVILNVIPTWTEQMRQRLRQILAEAKLAAIPAPSARRTRGACIPEVS